MDGHKGFPSEKSVIDIYVRACCLRLTGVVFVAGAGVPSKSDCWRPSCGDGMVVQIECRADWSCCDPFETLSVYCRMLLSIPLCMRHPTGTTTQGGQTQQERCTEQGRNYWRKLAGSSKVHPSATLLADRPPRSAKRKKPIGQTKKADRLKEMKLKTMKLY